MASASWGILFPETCARGRYSAELVRCCCGCRHPANSRSFALAVTMVRVPGTRTCDRADSSAVCRDAGQNKPTRFILSVLLPLAVGKGQKRKGGVAVQNLQVGCVQAGIAPILSARHHFLDGYVLQCACAQCSLAAAFLPARLALIAASEQLKVTSYSSTDARQCRRRVKGGSNRIAPSATRGPRER